MFEILDGLFVLFGGGHGGKRTQIFTFIRFGIFAARVDPKFAGFQFSDHLIFGFTFFLTVDRNFGLNRGEHEAY